MSLARWYGTHICSPPDTALTGGEAQLWSLDCSVSRSPLSSPQPHPTHPSVASCGSVSACECLSPSKIISRCSFAPPPPPPPHQGSFAVCQSICLYFRLPLTLFGNADSFACTAPPQEGRPLCGYAGRLSDAMPGRLHLQRRLHSLSKDGSKMERNDRVATCRSFASKPPASDVRAVSGMVVTGLLLSMSRPVLPRAVLC